MGNSRGIYKKSLAKAILLALEKTADGYARFEDFASNPGFYAYSIRDLRKSSLSQALKRLRERGLVENIELKGDIFLKLTEGGRDLISDQLNDGDWDGKYRIVIFDIPEQKRIIRNLFRRNLKKWDFKPLQKSVWISKRNVFDKLEAYIKDLGIEKWVIVLEVDRLSSHTIS